MSRMLLGVVCGLVFGIVDVAIMLPMSFPDKKAAISAAFITRFGIGVCNWGGTTAVARLVRRSHIRTALDPRDALITEAYARFWGWELSEEPSLA